jgi:glycosyltransferase involved in cell wall biosynthesis
MLERLTTALGVRHRVRILGQVAFGRLPDLYRSAAVVVAPSRAEGMPLALLEAMSCGRAVVASAIPQHLVVGEDAGVLFVPPGDADAMSQAIGSLLAEDDARKLAGEAARRQVVERFSWDSVAERFERFYLSLCRGPR